MSSAQAVAKGKMSGAIVTEKRHSAGTNQSAHSSGPLSARKLEESTEDFAHEHVNRDLSKAIAQARQTKKMTQKDLATAINERQQVVQQYESGQAIPNSQIILKLERVLGVRLPRK